MCVVVPLENGIGLLLGEEIFNFFVRNDFGLESVSAGFFRFHHFDAFGHVLTVSCGFERCDYLLCHDYLISRWMVTRFSMGLYFLRSIRSGVFFLFLVVM